MRTDPILPTSINDRINVLANEVARLEGAHNFRAGELLWCGDTVRVASTSAIGGTGFYWQFHWATIMEGSSLTMDAYVTVGEGAASLGDWCDWQLRYYQQVPSIYSDAEKTNRASSAHVVLAYGRVNGTGNAGEDPQDITTTVDIESYRGTYGRIEIWIGGSSDAFGERSYFTLNSFELTP